MRQIKFRAWNKEKSIMVYNDEDNEADYWDGAVANDVQMVNSCLNDPFDISEYLWMQWTGLLDKNGTEIYDGDLMRVKMPAIIKSEDKWDGNEIYSVDVEDYPEAEVIAEVRINPKHTILLVRKVITGDLVTKSTRLKIRKEDEVIGNIHENQELLK